MFSPGTTAAIVAIVNRHNQNRGQEKNSSVNSNRHTSPRLQHAAALSHGGASSQGLPSSATTESRRGGGTNTNPAPTQASRLPFDSVGWETPIGTYSISSISHSTKSQSRCSAVATDPPALGCAFHRNSARFRRNLAKRHRQERNVKVQSTRIHYKTILVILVHSGWYLSMRFLQ